MPPPRPYRFIHFYRNPVSKLSSGYLYHKTGVERWTDSFTLRADDVCGALDGGGRESKEAMNVCRALKLCKLCCAAVLQTAGIHGGGGLPQDFRPGTKVATRAAGVRGDVERAQDFLCQQVRSLRPIWKQQQHHGFRSVAEGIINGSRRRVSGGTSEDRDDPTFLDVLRGNNLTQGLLFEASVQFFENYRMAQIVHATARDRYTMHLELDEVMADFPTAISKILDFLEMKGYHTFFDDDTTASLAAGEVPTFDDRGNHGRPRSSSGAAVRGKHGRERQHHYSSPAKASAVREERQQHLLARRAGDGSDGSNRDKGDGGNGFEGMLSQRINPQSIEPWRALVKQHEAAIRSEATTFDMGHSTSTSTFSLSSIYSAVYNGALYRHTTTGGDKVTAKATLVELLCHHSGLRQVYAPIFAMLAEATGADFSPHERSCRELPR